MTTPRKCPACGATLPADFSGGCPVCALRGALELSGAEADVVVAEQPGDWIGQYNLVEKVGEGGMGTVWRAEQVEPIRRRVALKVIKLGMDTRQVIARFEAERQALALMDHPNIAKVLEAGATDTGRPYFVMELVNGVRITDYCDQRQLSTKERLDLFIQVCHAVQHAHQKGVIHRDLKPSNILVTLQDGVPVPKVIDFGIAKATTQQRLTDKTLSTALHQFLGTPAYMSPEQAELSGVDVDTRSDIYSLGVLLYELLTSQLPFEVSKLLQAGWDEMRRMIREQEPPKPSTRLSTMTAADLTKAADGRDVESPKLLHLVRGDLDWIVMKCLEKDRARRYDAPSDLANDLTRHLRSEPVVACPAGYLYKFQKLVRRNKLPFVAGLMVVLALLAGLLASTWEAVRAGRAERESNQVVQFLQAMLKGVGPSVALGRDTKLLREILDHTTERVGKELNRQPEVEARLLGIIGAVYSDLGDYGQAEAISRTALNLRRKSGAERREVADALNNLANVFYREGKLNEAGNTQREALALRRRLFGNKHPDVASSLNNLANVLREQGQLRQAEAMFREALALRRERLGETNNDTAESLDNLGGILSLEDKLPEAEAMQREALALNRRLLGSLHPDLAISMNNLADTLTAEGKLPEAEAIDRDTLTMRLKLLGNEHPDVAFSLFNLATVLAAEGKWSDAEATNRVALAMRRKLLGNEHLDVASSLNNLAGVLINENKLDEAETLQREALAIQRQRLGQEHPDIAGSLDNLAVILKGRGRLAEAEASEREVLAMRRKLLGEEHLDVALSLHNLADLLQTQHQLAEAETRERQALTLRLKLLGTNHTDVGVSLGALANILHEEGRFQEAAILQRQESALWQKALQDDPAHPISLVGNYADALSRLARTLLADQKASDCESVTRAWLSLTEKQLPDSWQLFDARATLGACLAAQKRFGEAESLLLSGYEGMRQREKDMPAECQNRLTEVVESLIRLYEATGHTAVALEWQKKARPLK